MVARLVVAVSFAITALVAAVPPSYAQDFTALIDEMQHSRAVGPPIRRVAFLGLRDGTGLERQLQGWLLPRRAVRDEVALRLLAAATTRFEIIDAEIPPDLTQSAELLFAFDVTPVRIAELNLGLDVDAVLVARLAPTWDPTGAAQVEALLLSGRAPAIAFEAEGVAAVPASLFVWNPRALVWLLLGVALVASKPRRVAGTLVVKLEQPTRSEEIVYTALVGRKSQAVDSSEKNLIASALITGDTVSFQKLPARTLYVAVRRLERDPKTLHVKSNHVEERQLTLAHGRQNHVAFQFKADLTTVEVRLRHGEDKPVTEQALLAVRAKGASSRYVRGGAASLQLPEGNHVLLLGFVDRGFRVPLRIPARAREVEVKINVDATAKAFFTDCRDAVAPFVGGDLAAAADALAAAGRSEAAAVLLAELHRERGEGAKAAALLESAGRFKEAAELRAESGDSAGTAALLERAGDFAGAAVQHKKAGNFAAAGRAFLRARAWSDALDCAQRSGDRALLADVFEQKGDRLEGARLAIELGDPERATRLLQSMPHVDPSYGEACLLLAQIFCASGEPELALQKLDEAVDTFGSETSLELREQIAQKLEAKGEWQKALEAYEHIRKRDIRYPGMAEKVEALRGRLKEAAAVDGAATRIAKGTAPDEESRYEIEDEIGRGGMGVVFRARDKTLGRVVALKRLPDNLREHPTAVRLFLREARSVAALNHPNIVTLYDAGQEGGVYYLTMEYLEGKPLHVPIAQRGRFGVSAACKLGVQVMDGLECAHEVGIVHRDIKPSNLFLTKKGRVKIMDFGLAKMMEEVRKKASIIAGTPYYMAPEQGLGDAVDPRADLYAFGVTLYELVVGDVPFRDGDVAYHHRHTPPPDPRTKVPEVPVALAELIGALMAKAPAGRPASAAVVREQLTSILRRI